jgi:osmoprotectant transport system ATP-binding protein
VVEVLRVPAPSVEFDRLGYTLADGRALLQDVSLAVAPATTLALLGRSGSGKTTLLRTVNGLVRPTSGAVLVGGAAVNASDVIALRRRIGYVIQETGLFPHWTVERNIAATLEIAGKSAADGGERVREMLELVGLQPEFAKRMPHQLSGGQRQRVGLARALAGEPEVLLMDEPFGALDPLTRGEMQQMLRALLRRLKITTLIVTHDLAEALVLADRIVLVEAGRIAANVASAEFVSSPLAAVQQYVQAAMPPELRHGQEATAGSQALAASQALAGNHTP